MKKLSYLAAALFLSHTAYGQADPAPLDSPSPNISMEILIGAFIATALMVLLASLAMLRAFKVIAQEMQHPSPLFENEKVEPLEYEEWQSRKSSKPGIWTKLLGLKPISEESELIMEHEFDGIAELDNPTPAWFMWLFYGTIVFAFSYMMYFHVFDYGKMQEEEYEIEMAEAKIEKEAYLAKAGNNIDENSVKEDLSEAVIISGKAVYTSNCVACHGDKGQGLVGPNLTDKFWLHGGTVNSVFKTIKYGVPEKGMIPWEKTLSQKQIADVSNYIISLKGSNPANPKAAQGAEEG
ncbi:cbb3-type cytochrome c oxidase N-terminal domain-containing protein [Daejeonella lutea]|uniref:Cytochrome c oxidase cbb3-type subunit 3 n=1 Tax=Daejeonella lutea TaxID=572036 RepID=A0A1T5A593_9SPHI|nr:cbb3-type cytochrome c oxidase N-terminal domain-containing protein [Daejeonella lutea]SKB29813.1 cytochrome c oxidase cbb3-type subunit 3 [Daejeonella lutea]